jgi:putative transposase
LFFNKHTNPPDLVEASEFKFIITFDMADTYSKIYIHVVFAVKNRHAMISPEWEEELYKYITGIVQNKGQKMLAINGNRNHVHLFIGLKPSICLSDLVREIKKSSDSMIREKRLSPFAFQWQEGFGAFSYGHSQLTDVIQYIENQKEHHKKRTFKEEYLAFLKAFEIEFKDEYLFEWIDV